MKFLNFLYFCESFLSSWVRIRITNPYHTGDTSYLFPDGLLYDLYLLLLPLVRLIRDKVRFASYISLLGSVVRVFFPLLFPRIQFLSLPNLIYCLRQTGFGNTFVLWKYPIMRFESIFFIVGHNVDILFQNWQSQRRMLNFEIAKFCCIQIMGSYFIA